MNAHEGWSERRDQPRLWLHEYNWHRPHSSLNQNTPISRAGLQMNNLLTIHS